MSAATSNNNNNNNNTTETCPPITEAEDVKMFQAARRSGRRNALGDLSEHLAQIDNPSSSSDVEKMAPHFQTMSIKN